ncbi:MAG: SAF domain-containing protein [bacterium]|nr:SAF domain-containing protein [bacterium]
MRKREAKRGSISPDKWKAGGIVATLVAALAVFGVMLQMEKNVLTKYEKGTVYVTVTTVPRGQIITAQNYGQYFAERELDRSCISDSALRSPEQITDMAARLDIEPGVLLTEGMFEKRSEALSGMKEPVVAGFKAEDLYQVVGGTLRAGDRIHIYSVSQESEAVLIWDNIYVQEVFDQTGARIGSGDTETAAQRINVYIDKCNVEAFYTELASGTLRVVKKCN